MTSGAPAAAARGAVGHLATEVVAMGLLAAGFLAAGVAAGAGARVAGKAGGKKTSAFPLAPSPATGLEAGGLLAAGLLPVAMCQLGAKEASPLPPPGLRPTTGDMLKLGGAVPKTGGEKQPGGRGGDAARLLAEAPTTWSWKNFSVVAQPCDISRSRCASCCFGIIWLLLGV